MEEPIQGWWNNEPSEEQKQSSYTTYYSQVNPVLYIFIVNNLDSLTNEIMAQDVAATVCQFNQHSDIVLNGGFNALNQSIAFETTLRKWKNQEYVEETGKWRFNDEYIPSNIKIIPINKNKIEGITAKALVDDNSSFRPFMLCDTYTDENYPFVVNSREVAELLVNSNNSCQIISFDDKTNQVLMTRPQIICAYLFGDENNEKFKEFISEIKK